MSDVSEPRVLHEAACNGERFREAQETMWPGAGAWAHDTFVELNAEYFDGEVAHAGIVWGLTPHGHALAHTYADGRITLHPALLDPRDSAWGLKPFLGTAYARDVLLHEMIHALLFGRGGEHSHNTQPWCDELVRLAPLLGLRSIKAVPVVPRRIDGVVVRRPLDGHLERAAIAAFPHSLRRRSFYESDRDRIGIRI